MIGFIEGKILKKLPGYVIISSNGVGYEISVPLSTYNNLKNEGEIDSLFIYTFHKDEILTLYGFKTEDEKDLFKILLTASGVGPKLALNIISNVDVETFKFAIFNQDIKLLTSIAGIGKKRAEKLIFELKEKFISFYGPDYTKTKSKFFNIQKEAILALEALGYSRKEIFDVISNIKLNENIKVEEVVKECLKNLSKV